MTSQPPAVPGVASHGNRPGLRRSATCARTAARARRSVQGPGVGQFQRPPHRGIRRRGPGPVPGEPARRYRRAHRPERSPPPSRPAPSRDRSADPPRPAPRAERRCQATDPRLRLTPRHDRSGPPSEATDGFRSQRVFFAIEGAQFRRITACGYRVISRTGAFATCATQLSGSAGAGSRHFVHFESTAPSGFLRRATATALNRPAG
jgi:hypothetical protein